MKWSVKSESNHLPPTLPLTLRPLLLHISYPSLPPTTSCAATYPLHPPLYAGGCPAGGPGRRGVSTRGQQGPGQPYAYA